MTQVNTDGLPPEMQQRIAQIIEQAKTNPAIAPQPQAQAPVQPPAPVVKAPSLMDHVVALRQEVAAMRQEQAAVAQVVEACGQATGALYQMFQQQTTATNYGSTYQEEQVESDY